MEGVSGVTVQEATRAALLESLLKLHLESLREALREELPLHRLDALEAAGPGVDQLALSLWSVVTCIVISASTIASSSETETIIQEMESVAKSTQPCSSLH